MKTKNKTLIIALMLVIMTVITIILTKHVLSISSGVKENRYTTWWGTNNPRITYEFTDFSDWKIGATMNLNDSVIDSTYPKGFQLIRNKNFYCIEMNQNHSKGTHAITGIIKIIGGKVTTAQVVNNSTKQTVTLNINNNDASKKANNVLTEIIKQAKEKEGSVYTAAWRAYRERGEGFGNGTTLSIDSDVYQRILWKHLASWKQQNFGKSELDNYIITSSGDYDGSESYLKRADEEARSIYNTISENANSNSESVYIERKDTTSNVDTLKRDTNGTYTYLGPFKVNYSGTISKITYNLDGKSNSNCSIAKYEGSTFTTISSITKLPNGQDFYIKVPLSEIDNKTKLGVSIKVKGTTQLETTLYILRHSGKTSTTNYQNFMYVNQKNATEEKSLTINANILQESEVSIKKQDQNGNDLKVAGIKFEIYDSNKKNVGTLTTTANGTTNKIKLKVNTNYTLKETYNGEYGYKNASISSATISNGGTIKLSNGEVVFSVKEDSTITIKNTKELGKLTIQKTGSDGENLKGVQFVLWKGVDNGGQNNFIKLNDDSVTNPIETSDSGLDITKYKVTYVAEAEKATKFKTNASGKIVINNLEIYSNRGTKYQYWILEMQNSNYGYKGMDLQSTNVSISGGNKLEIKNSANNTHAGVKFNITQNTIINMKNIQELGNLKIEKYDKDNKNIKLENVGFAIEVSPAPSKRYAYLVLYDENGKIVSNVKETVKINDLNKANNTEYKVDYYCSNTKVTEMSETEKANITTFVTGANGTLNINNLEIYGARKENKNTYKLIEMFNSNYGYVIGSTDLGAITLTTNKTVTKTISNEQKYTKISGFVWIENPAGKSNNYDTIFTDGSTSTDIKLTDLYITDKNGKVTEVNQTPKDTKGPIEIKLYNKKDKAFIKTQPDIFSSDGEYIFNEVMIEELENLSVVFEYNGLYYTTVVEKLDENQGSKVKEVESERTSLNNRFGEITKNDDSQENKGQAISTDGKNITSIEYNKESGHISTVSQLSPNTILSADTNSSGLNLKNIFNSIKEKNSTPVEKIENVNMGVVLREQPKLAIGSDIYSVSINVNNKNYNYYYNGRQQHYNNLNNDEAGVKFEQESSVNRYTRPVYSSDVEAYVNNNTTLGVSVTYKIQITNQSATLTSVVKGIANYFDADYTIEKIGLSISNNEIGTLIYDKDKDTANITRNINVEYETEEMKNEALNKNKSYNCVNIPLTENGTEGITIEGSKSKFIYIKFNINENAIKGLLTEESPYHNASEITNYSTYYGQKTGQQSENDNQEYFVTEQRKAGEIYAGVDKSSQPENAKLRLIYDTRDGQKTQTPILDSSNYEDDTSSAPSLLLQSKGIRIISGTIFEDKATNESLAMNEKLGDGIYDERNEKTIDGVLVELYEVDQDGKIKTEINSQGQEVKVHAKYSDGTPAIATMNGEGKYTFGNKDNNVGILPGDYVIQFTYNNKSYIVDSQNGNKYLNINDYKSTIITSEIIKKAINDGKNNSKWYTVKEENRYSDAVDNISLRNELDNDEVKYSTYKNSSLDTYIMEATTPLMEISVEFTENNEADALKLVRIEELENIDFGIIERPDTNMIVDKKITGLEITTQTGANIIPKGNPSNPGETMQYVKTGLDGLVSAEIEPKMLQGATLNLEYSITVTNECQKDYEGSNYYLYGTGREHLKVQKVKKLVDYLDATMEVSIEGNSWTEIKTEEEIRKLFTDGLISQEVCETLLKGGYHILLTEEFYELENPGDSKTLKVYATKYLATSNSVEENNRVEIIELTGGRTIKEAIPGNYDPSKTTSNEKDEDIVKFQITAPTGATVNYILYVIAAVGMFIILVVGIIMTKKYIAK